MCEPIKQNRTNLGFKKWHSNKYNKNVYNLIYYFINTQLFNISNNYTIIKLINNTRYIITVDNNFENNFLHNLS